MIELTKVNENWIPLQTKVFSRWISNQLKDFPNIEINDILKDLSNGVALVNLATVLTHKKLTRQWSINPKLKVEKVQNCDLAIDMFERDGVNFIGISGKDISDNNQKLILDLIWTLILHYSVNQSIIGEKDKRNLTTSSKSNKSNQKSQIDSKKELLSWANQRIENYPNIHNFTPYNLSLCALVDSYLPNKINYYSLNPSDSEYNSNLAIKAMKEIGIPIYVYTEELKNTDNTVDEKTLLTQLSSAKLILDKIHIIEPNSNSKSEISSNSDEISKLREKISQLEQELQIQAEARQNAENETAKAQLELTHLKIELEEEKLARMKAEDDLETEQIENEDYQNVIGNLTQSLTKLQRKYKIIFSEIIERNSEIQRLRVAWDMAQIEIENERDARQEAEFELESLKSKMNEKVANVFQTEKECRIQSFMSSLCEVKTEINNRIDFYIVLMHK